MKKFIQSEPVLIISAVLALISSFFVAPSAAYLSYIDFRTLALLFGLMSVTAGFKSLGIFAALSEKLLSLAGSARRLALTLILLCFFLSMLVTNDVSLITVVPFTVIALKTAGIEHYLIPLVTLETISANLGSMTTPIGNPQNIYLFSKFNMTVPAFLGAVLPYSIASLLLLTASALFFGRESVRPVNKKRSENRFSGRKIYLIMYFLMFVSAILTVFNILHWQLLIAVFIVLLALFDRHIFSDIDYSLLLTFVFLFIFIGNLGNIPFIADALKNAVNGREVLSGVLLSQIFSNVPAAILLSGFTDNSPALLTGVNLGGLGTLIASMASLISFRLISKENISSVKYILVFTVCNVLFLAVLLGLYFIIG